MLSSIKPILARAGLSAQRDLTLPPALTRSLLPLVILAIAVTAVVLMLLWRDQASFRPLFGAHEKVAVADMMAALDAQAVPYRIHPETGQVLVPESQLGAARMMLAAKGVSAQLPIGLELMDRNDPLGVSQFVQDVRFRRGLEGELAQSISTLDAVSGARVHLSIAKSSSFVLNDAGDSSASVVLSLKPGRQLEAGQIAAIINLVANSVAKLPATRVSVVDQAGNLLSAQVDLSDGVDSVPGTDAARRHQAETLRNAESLLASVLGVGNFRVSVSAEVYNDRIQETHERYGDVPKVLSEAVREESGSDPLAVGVPGSLSNRPVAGPPAPDSSAPPAAATAQKNANTRQYTYDRSITQIQQGRGRLRRLNVAVAVNSTAGPGNAAWTAESLADIERLLRGGLGISSERGDTLVVTALPFPPLPESLPWWQERDTVLQGVEYALRALGLLALLLFVVRPVIRLMRQRWAPPIQTVPEVDITPEPPALPMQAAAFAAPGAAAVNGAVTPLLEAYDLPPPGSPVDVLVDHLKELAAKEPERVAEVVKQWVQKRNGPVES